MAAVVFPFLLALWESTMIELRSNIELHLEHNATILAHPDLDAYPVRTVAGHNKDRQPYHLVLADACTNIAITGPGVLDGNGYAFWDEPIRDILARGEEVDFDKLNPTYRTANNQNWWRERSKRISPLIEIRHCSNIRLEGITIRHSPGWTVHPYCCENMYIHGITILNDLFGPNTDGIDLNGCRDVRISDCDLTCGDDAIILKATSDARSCERIAVSNCILATNCAALGLGAETTHAIRNITFTGCVVRQAIRAIQIQMWEPGLIENVTMSNISGDSVCPLPLQRGIYVDIQHHGRDDGKLGRCRNILFNNISLTTRGRSILTAADGAVLENIVLRDVQMRFPAIEDASQSVPNSFSSQMSNDAPEARVANAGLVVSNAVNLLVDNFHALWPENNEEDTFERRSDYISNPPMHGIWLRNVNDSVIRCPFLKSYRPEDGADRIHSISSTFTE